MVSRYAQHNVKKSNDLLKCLTNWSNDRALDAIKRIYKRGKHKEEDDESKTKMVNEAMHIYANIDGEKKNSVINAMIKLLIQSKQYHHIQTMWHDIQEIDRKNTISCPVIIKCLVLSHLNERDIISKSIITLHWMAESKYNLKHYEVGDYSLSVSKLISICSNMSDLERIHSLTGDTEDIFIATAFINAFGTNAEIQRALSVFYSVNDKQRDGVLIGSMMNALISNQHSDKALEIYQQHQHISDDGGVHILAIRACINTNNEDAMQNILKNIKCIQHTIAIKQALIDLHGHFGDLKSAQNVFDSLQTVECTVYMIASMMKAFIKNEQHQNALSVYNNECSNIQMDDVCNVLAIKACANTKNQTNGQHIIQKHNLTHKSDVFIRSALINFYSQCGDLNSAQNTFDSIADSDKNIVIIGSMMEAYFDCNCYTECIKLFESVETINPALKMNAICTVIALKACTEATLYHFGQSIHRKLQQSIDENGWILKDLSVQINLINMYGKCGKLEEAKKIFDEIKASEYEKYCAEVSVWNAMVHAIARNADLEEAKNMLKRMKIETDLRPNTKTFVLLLNVCNHCGDLEEATDIWQNQINDDEMKYDEYVISSLIDCYSRKGQWEKARSLIEEFEEYSQTQREHMWMSLLSGFSKNKYDSENNVIVNEIYDQIKMRFGNCCT